MCTTNARPKIAKTKPATRRAPKKGAVDRIVDKDFRRPFSLDKQECALYRTFLGCVFGPTATAPQGDDLVLARATLDILFVLIKACEALRAEWHEFHGARSREFFQSQREPRYFLQQEETERQADCLRVRARALDAFGPISLGRLNQLLRDQYNRHYQLVGLHQRVVCALVAVLGTSGLGAMAFAPMDDDGDPDGARADVKRLHRFADRADGLCYSALRADLRLAKTGSNIDASEAQAG